MPRIVLMLMPVKVKHCLLLAALGAGLVQSVSATDKLPILQVGSEVYSNVTITTVTATDLYFSHAKGMGNAKLKNLTSELQARFKYDAVRGSTVEKAQTEATAIYLREAATNRMAPLKAQVDSEEVDAPTLDENGELVATTLYATSFRGQRPPTILVDVWLTPPPDVTNKFVLVDFWTTWAAPARGAIPHLNELQARFKEKLVVIGLSNEPVEEMKKMATPKVSYYVGTDTQARTMSAFQLQAIPHSVLIDPAGIVRYEGHSKYLDAANLKALIAKYSL